MALDVTPGPMPPDGTRLNVQADLDAFLEGTSIEGFNLDNFSDAGVAFIVSATEPPATAIRNRAVSWFKRGEGTLYHLLMFTPREGPTSGVTQQRWLAASGSRREQLVEYRFPVLEEGGRVNQTGEPRQGVYGVQVMAHGLMVPRVVQTLFTSHTDMSLMSDTTASWIGYWAEHHTDPIFAARETTTDNTGWSGHVYGVVYESGYCPLRVCGYTGPGKLVVRAGANSAAFWTPTGVTFRVTEPEVGFVLQSGASAAEGPLFGFLRPSLTHRNV